MSPWEDRVYAINGGPFTASAPDRRAAFQEALGTRGLLTQSGLSETIHRQAIIEQLEWLISWQDPAGETAGGLKALARRLRDGGAAARWMRGLTVDFGRLLRRAKRTRNAIVHGGPIAPGTVAAVLTFVDWLAVDALDLVLRARMTGRDPCDAFAERTARFTRCLAELDAGVPPAKALFWEPSPDI